MDACLTLLLLSSPWDVNLMLIVPRLDSDWISLVTVHGQVRYQDPPLVADFGA